MKRSIIVGLIWLMGHASFPGTRRIGAAQEGRNHHPRHAERSGYDESDGANGVTKAHAHVDVRFSLGSDLQGKVQPNLAEPRETSSDEKIYTFRLRKAVMFHNGKELSSEDIKFSMNYTMEPKNGAYGFSQLSLVERVEAPEKYLLRVYFKKPSAVLLSSLAGIQSFPVIRMALSRRGP